MSEKTLIERLRIEADATEELHPQDSEIAVMREAADELERRDRQQQVRDGEETGWVIEREDSEPSRPMYYAGFEWDYDHLKAMRFARKEDAQTMCRYMFPGEPHRIADHAWVR